MFGCPSVDGSVELHSLSKFITMTTQGPNLLQIFVALAVLSTIFVPVHCLQCRFKLGTYTYDLCPLFFTFDSSLSSITSPRNIRIQKDTSTPPTISRDIYDIDLGGEGLKKDPTLPENEQVRFLDKLIFSFYYILLGSEFLFPSYLSFPL